jgi:acyl-CoA synthetase (AMP-forming)/AMP-acid ligase II
VSLQTRAATLFVAFAAVIAGAVFIIIHYLLGKPATVDYTAVAKNGQVNVVLQDDPQTTVSSRPDWVSYFIQDPTTHNWVHTTLFTVPANTRVNITILGYDGCTPLRNNYWSQIQGTIGNTVSVQQFKNSNQPLGSATNLSVINSWSHCNVAHTFAIPNLGLFVPVASPNASATLCSTSPCTSGPYSLEKFSFMTPKSPGQYRWQCFIPCGGGFLDGNGGPMQTLGYMTGFMAVAH